MKHTALEREGAKIEPRLARALYRAQAKVRSSVPVYDLMVSLQQALSAKNVEQALEALSRELIEDALKPAAKVIESASIKGSKIAANDINRRSNGRRR